MSIESHLSNLSHLRSNAGGDRHSNRASRGRRSGRPSGDDRELAILTTAEQLLQHRQLGDISVDDLAKGAGISRPTFYFYYPSKDAVLLTLFERVIVEADSALEGMVANPPADLKALWRIGINVFVETFGSHRAVRWPPTPRAPIPTCASCGRGSWRSGSATSPR